MQLFRFVLSLLVLVSFSTLARGQAFISAGPGHTAGLSEAIWARGGYQFTENWRAAGTFAFFLDPVENTSFFELSFDAHYIFPVSENFQAYPLAGINLLFQTVDEGDGDTDFGVNAGLGSEFLINDQMSIPAEVRFVMGEADRIWIGLGFQYLFGARP